jgi:hypothetical protein
MQFHPVSGDRWTDANRCAFERGLPDQGPNNKVRESGICGLEGRFWEAKADA